jgi:hypothetical protein
MNRNKVLFISHDATRTGAPIILLHLLKWIRKNTDISIEILLKDGGPMENDFRSVGPTNVLNWSNSIFNQKDKEHFLNELAGRDFAVIYSNTIANGQLLEYLAAADCPIVTHIHELDFRIRHQTRPEVIAGVLSATDHYIAVSNAVQQNLIFNHGVSEQ